MDVFAVNKSDDNSLCSIDLYAKNINNVINLYNAIKNKKYKNMPFFTVYKIGADRRNYAYVQLKINIPDIIPIIKHIIDRIDTKSPYYSLKYYTNNDNSMIEIGNYGKKKDYKKIIDFTKKLNEEIGKYIESANAKYLSQYLNDSKKYLEKLVKNIKKPEIKTPNFHPFNDTPFKKPYVKVKPQAQIIVESNDRSGDALDYSIRVGINIDLNISFRNRKKFLKEHFSGESDSLKLLIVTDAMYNESYYNILMRSMKNYNIHNQLFALILKNKGYDPNFPFNCDVSKTGVTFKDSKGKLSYTYRFFLTEPDIKKLEKYDLSSLINKDLQIITQFVYNSVVLDYLVREAYAMRLPTETYLWYKEKISEFLSDFRINKQEREIET